MTIRETVRSRGIRCLTHFTRVENIDSILAHGLVTRTACRGRGFESIFSDEYRHDGQDAICLSISFPNYKMFYQLRQRNSDAKWAVLGVDPSVLWKKDCAFCVTNAAKNEVSGVPIQERKGAPALELMFAERGSVSRKELSIPESYPTDPQAEVLVFETIEPNLITGLAFNDSDVRKKFKERLEGRYKVLDNSRYFDARRDFQSWR
ncbi:MAG TPA: DarT ssDNA thymidine ADP-ribosyltransferase family protein [Steroidobacteraceae bacterium]|nr:DarT ssDNA thymidine ADP-ribosyltransferase family protein [Steroidobacteraceae bacterium]